MKGRRGKGRQKGEEKAFAVDRGLNAGVTGGEKKKR